MSSKCEVSDDLRVSLWSGSNGNGETCAFRSTPISGYVEVAIDDLQNDDLQSSRALYNMKKRESKY